MTVSEKSRWLILLVVSSALFLIEIGVARISTELEPMKRAFPAKPASRKQGWEAAGKQQGNRFRAAPQCARRSRKRRRASLHVRRVCVRVPSSTSPTIERAVNRVFDSVNAIDDLDLRRQQIERLTTLLGELGDSAL